MFFKVSMICYAYPGFKDVPSGIWKVMRTVCVLKKFNFEGVQEPTKFPRA
jgi:hypothetical protein